MLFVIYLCEDSTPPRPDSPKDDDLMLPLVSLSIAGMALIVILVIFLKRRSYGVWNSMVIPVAWDIMLCTLLKL